MDPKEITLLSDLKRSLELLVKLRIEEIRGNRSQKDLIMLLDSLGCRPSEIAGFLGTTTRTVNPVLSRSRRK